MNLDHLPFGLQGDDALIVMTGAAALVAVMLAWALLTPKRPMAGRAKFLIERRETLQAETAIAQRRSRRRAQSDHGIGFMRMVVDRLNLLQSTQAESIQAKLARGGVRTSDAVIRYLFFKFTLPLAFVGLGVFVFYVSNLYDISPLGKGMATAILGWLGLVAPDLYIRNLASKRGAKLRKALPDGLDLLVICAEAGLYLDAALTRVADEIRESHPELSDEFGLAAVELGFLPDRRRALENLANRTNLQPLRALVNTLQQSEKYGTPMAQSLRVLSAELRHERLMKAEEKAARLPAIMTVPMIVFILPPLFVVLLAPAALEAIDKMSNVY